MERAFGIEPENNDEQKEKVVVEKPKSEDIFEGEYEEKGFIEPHVRSKVEQVSEKFATGRWVRDREVDAAMGEITKQIGKDPDYKDPDYIFDRQEKIEEFLRRRDLLLGVGQEDKVKEFEMIAGEMTPLEEMSYAIEECREAGAESIADILTLYTKIAYDQYYDDYELDRIISLFEGMSAEKIGRLFGSRCSLDDDEMENYWEYPDSNVTKFIRRLRDVEIGRASKGDKIALLDAMVQFIHRGGYSTLSKWIGEKSTGRMYHIETITGRALGRLSSNYPVYQYERDKTNFYKAMKMDYLDDTSIDEKEPLRDISSALKFIRYQSSNYPEYNDLADALEIYVRLAYQQSVSDEELMDAINKLNRISIMDDFPHLDDDYVGLIGKGDDWGSDRIRNINRYNELAPYDTRAKKIEALDLHINWLHGRGYEDTEGEMIFHYSEFVEPTMMKILDILKGEYDMKTYDDEMKNFDEIMEEEAPRRFLTRRQKRKLTE